MRAGIPKADGHHWIIVLVLFALPVHGCKDSSPGSPRASAATESREYWLRDIRLLLENKYLPEQARARFLTLATELENNQMPLPMRILQVGIARNKDTGQPVLIADFWDEQRSLYAVRIREYDQNGKMQYDESYEIYPRGRSQGPMLDSLIIPVSIRTDRQRKDVRAWEDYISKGIVSRELLPTLWMSIPSRDVRVGIALVGIDGSESGEVSFDFCEFPSGTDKEAGAISQ